MYFGLFSTVVKNFQSKYNFEKERAYFEKVDEEELIEESPSPIPRTWVAGIPKENVEIPKLCTALEKWLLSKKLNFGLGSSNTLARILQTPGMRPSPSSGINFESSSVKTPERSSKVNSRLSSGLIKFDLSLLDRSVHEMNTTKSLPEVGNEGLEEHYEDIDAAVKELSLLLTSEELDRFNALLEVCEQSSPSKLQDVFSKYWSVPYIFVLYITNVSVSFFFYNLDFLFAAIPSKDRSCFHKLIKDEYFLKQ